MEPSSEEKNVSAASTIKWHEVTWYSKLGAIILFLIVVPVLCFYIGVQYELTKQALHAPTYGPAISPTHITQTNVFGENELLFDLIKVDPFRSAWIAMLKGEKDLPTWVINENMVSNSSEIVVLGDKKYILAWGCQPHNCPNQLTVLFDPDTQKAWGYLEQKDYEPSSEAAELVTMVRWLGNPSQQIKDLMFSDLRCAGPAARYTPKFDVASPFAATSTPLYHFNTRLQACVGLFGITYPDHGGESFEKFVANLTTGKKLLKGSDDVRYSNDAAYYYVDPIKNNVITDKVQFDQQAQILMTE